MVLQNLTPNDPDLQDLINEHGRGLKLEINCHHVGVIQSFNPTLQTAQATIAYKKSYFKPDGNGGYSSYLVDYPLVFDAPVICPGGGGGAITFPIAKGDECLLLFNDRDLDNWFTGGTNAEPATARLHSFSDAIILVGVRSAANVLQGYDASRVCLSLGPNTRVAVSSTDVALEYGVVGALQARVSVASGAALLQVGTNSFGLANSGQVTFTNGTTSLKTVLTNLTTQLTNLTAQLTALSTALATPGNITGVAPSGGGAITAGEVLPAALTTFNSQISTIQTGINNVATQVGSLLA